MPASIATIIITHIAYFDRRFFIIYVFNQNTNDEVKKVFTYAIDSL